MTQDKIRMLPQDERREAVKAAMGSLKRKPDNKSEVKPVWEYTHSTQYGLAEYSHYKLKGWEPCQK